MLRQIFYAGIRLGTYEQMRDFLALRMRRKEGSGIFEKILAAVSTGAVAIIIASPADLLKVQFFKYILIKLKI